MHVERRELIQLIFLEKNDAKKLAQIDYVLNQFTHKKKIRMSKLNLVIY